jgi:hypothetical protein
MVDARAAAGIPFVQVEDASTWTHVPVEMWDRIRDRGIVFRAVRPDSRYRGARSSGTVVP